MPDSWKELVPIVLAAIAFLLLVLLLAGHRDQERTLREWEIVLNPDGAQTYDHVSAQLAFNAAAVRESYMSAERAQAEGRLEEALRYLSLGSRMVSSCSDDLLGTLRSLGSLARHASAIAPIPPLRPSGFRARELATLAGLHIFGHHLLITTRERLRLRLAVLRCAVRAASALLLRATWRTREAPSKAAGWARIGALRADLGTLTDESLLSLRAVLASLAAVRRPAAEGARRKTA